MIEISHVNRRRFYIGVMLIIISLPGIILCSAIFTASVTWGSNDLLMLIPIAVEGVFIFILLRFYKNSVYRIETVGDEYRLTMLDNHQIVIQPHHVKRILHSGERDVLVLDNKRRLTLEKTSKYLLFTAGIDHQDPWLPLLTKERFPESEFGPLPLG